MPAMYLMAPQTFRDNSRFDMFRLNGGENYAEHILITMSNYLSNLCKKEILDCLNIPEERRDGGLEGECLRVLSKHRVKFTHDMLLRCEKIN